MDNLKKYNIPDFIKGGGPAVTTQRTFRWIDDDAGLDSATFLENEGDDHTITAGDKIRLRVAVQETNGGVDNINLVLYSSYNSASYVPVSTTATYVRAVTSDNSITDSTSITTQRLSNGSGTWENGRYDDDGVSENTIGLSSEYTEVEFCIQPQWASLNNNDTLDFRVYISGGTPLDGYTDTARLTVSKAGGVNVEVPAGSLALTGYAPTVEATANVNITVPAGTLGVTGYAPTVAVSDNKNITVPAGALTLTGYAPTVAVSDNKNITVPAGSLTVTGYAPTVETTANVNITVPAGSLALTGYAPTVEVSGAVNVEVPAGSLTLTGYAPTVETTANVNITVPAGSITLTGYAPTVTASDHIEIEIPAGSLTLTGYAPTVEVSTPALLSGLALSDAAVTGATLEDEVITTATLTDGIGGI